MLLHRCTQRPPCLCLEGGLRPAAALVQSSSRTLAHAPACTRLHPLMRCPACLAPQVVTTLTTVGFGDVVAQTMLGRAVIILTICFGVVAIPVQVGPGVRYSSHGSHGRTYLAPPCQHSHGLAYLAPPCQPAPLSPARPPASVVCPQCAAHAIVPCRRHSCMPSSRRGGWCAVSTWLCSCPLHPLCCCMHSTWAGWPASICAAASTCLSAPSKVSHPHLPLLLGSYHPLLQALCPAATGALPWCCCPPASQRSEPSQVRAAHPPDKLPRACRSMRAAAMPPGMRLFCPAPRRQCWPAGPSTHPLSCALRCACPAPRPSRLLLRVPAGPEELASVPVQH